MAARLRIAGGRLALLALLLAALAAHVYPASAETWFEYMGIEPPFNPEGNVLKPLTAGYIRTSSDDYFKYWIINQGVEYVTRPVNGKMATVFTIPPNGSLTLTIALNNVRLNATTRVHVEVCFLTPSPPLSLCFGALRPHYDRSSPEKYSLGGGYYAGAGFILYFAQENVSFRIDGLVIPNCLVGEWYAADLSTSMVPSATVGVDCWNFTGLYFACPAYADVSIFCSSYNEPVEVAIANFAIWDEKPDRLHEIQTSPNTITGELNALNTALSALGVNVTQLIIESENRTIVQMQTLLGPVNAALEELGGKVAAVHGNVANVLIPGLGEVKAVVVEGAGKAAKIEWIAAAAAALSLIAAASSILGLLKALKEGAGGEKTTPAA